MRKSSTRLRQITFTHLRQNSGSLAFAALCMGGYTLAELLAPWPLKIIFDHILLDKPLSPSLSALNSVMQSGKTQAIVLISCGILLIAICRGMFAYAQLFLTSRLGYQMVYALRRELFAHLQRLSLSFHNRARGGELLTKVTSDTSTLRDVFSSALLDASAQLLTLAGMFSILFLLNWQLSLIVLTTFPVLCYAVFVIYRRLRVSAGKQREREGRIAARISETLSSVRLVQAFARERYEQERFDAESAETMTESVRTARLEARAARTVEIINSFGIWAAVLFGALFVIEGRMTPGDVLIFTAYLTSMYKPLRNLAKLSTQFSRAGVSAERISEILEIEADTPDDVIAVRAGKLRGEIVFAQVSFDYGDSQSALTDVSFSIKPGQMVALVGASGAGKSTIASLLMRFYKTQRGAILIDGLNINAYQRESLRSKIAVVLQDSLLFGASIRENIAYGNPLAGNEEIETAARFAHAHEFIVSLPDGYDTIIGERGCTLSGGQRQRLCLARAIIRESSILILDEPTAAIDAQSTSLIHQTIDQWRRGKTTLVITHQLQTMERFDQIIVLRAGRVVEMGTHAELWQRGGYYAELFRLQGHNDLHSIAAAKQPVKAQTALPPPERFRITQAMRRVKAANDTSGHNQDGRVLEAVK